MLARRLQHVRAQNGIGGGGNDDDDDDDGDNNNDDEVANAVGGGGGQGTALRQRILQAQAAASMRPVMYTSGVVPWKLGYDARKIEANLRQVISTWRVCSDRIQ